MLAESTIVGFASWIWALLPTTVQVQLRVGSLEGYYLAPPHPHPQLDVCAQMRGIVCVKARDLCALMSCGCVRRWVGFVCADELVAVV